jgi:hypothetical protein
MASSLKVADLDLGAGVISKNYRMDRFRLVHSFE